MTPNAEPLSPNPRHQIPSLDNGSTYTVQVRAVNLTGTGPPASETGVPVTVPGLPTSLTLRSNMGNLLVSWDEPAADDGGSPVTGYLVQWKDTGEEFSDTERRATVTEPRHQITGLTIGNEYTVSVAAINATGTGPAVTESLLLAENPGAPNSLVVTARNQNLAVSWQSPTNEGSTPISEYRVLWKGAGEDYDDSACSHRRVTVSASGKLLAYIGPFRNGDSYDVRVIAVNASGSGSPADTSGTPAAIPGRPLGLGAFSIDDGLHLAWDTPWNGGSPITEYRIQWIGHRPGIQRNRPPSDGHRYIQKPRNHRAHQRRQIHRANNRPQRQRFQRNRRNHRRTGRRSRSARQP